MSVGSASEWRERLASAAEAVSIVRPGDRVFVGSACATPRTLLEALERRRVPPEGVVVTHVGLATAVDAMITVVNPLLLLLICLKP